MNSILSETSSLLYNTKLIPRYFFALIRHKYGVIVGNKRQL